MDTLVGQRIGYYDVRRRLASGGMADIYLAADTSRQRPVCLKVMQSRLMQNAELIKRFQREAAMTTRLRHPHIVSVYESGILPNTQPYLVMEYLPGGSLEDWLRRQMTGDTASVESGGSRGGAYGSGEGGNATLPDWVAGGIAPQAAVDVLLMMRQVGQALEYIHQAGMVHRDLKPSNVLLRQDGTAVVTDLGIVAVHETTRLTHTGQLLGTPAYMSPEQASGKPVDGRADIYAFGVMLYELLSGQRPFTGQTNLEILEHHLKDTPTPLLYLRPELSLATAVLVETCLQKDPANRFADVTALLAAIEQALQAERELSLSPQGGSVWLPATGQMSVRRQIASWLAHRPRWGYALWGGVGVLLLLAIWLGSQVVGARETAVSLAPTLGSATPTLLAIGGAASPVSLRPPVSAPPVSAPPVSAPPVSAPPVSAPPTSTLQPVQPTTTLPPTATATPMPIPATNTPTNHPSLILVVTAAPDTGQTPLPNGLPCITAGDRWGATLYAEYQTQLGCPQTTEIRTGGAFQRYAQALAVWREDRDIVYFLFDDGTYVFYSAKSATPDYYLDDLHKGAFGYFWNTNADLRHRLGEAQAAEAITTDFAVQDFLQGTIFYFYENGARNYVLFASSGTWLSRSE